MDESKPLLYCVALRILGEDKLYRAIMKATRAAFDAYGWFNNEVDETFVGIENGEIITSEFPVPEEESTLLEVFQDSRLWESLVTMILALEPDIARRVMGNTPDYRWYRMASVIAKNTSLS